ncbi:hypothetical protein C923_00703 [Plasmodium falciparum UGT5.1]|uniref:Erythrocyte membrane protein 1 n=1 Tax=Plasmodium falciparum UGT5.1 TaxID=1237627 RepID=W7JIE6_PLAFA|nr:hypothetical protein C923_00703 [Plasmodium falciparum UGT5.1]
MAPSTTYSSAKNAKELLDMIGKDVHDKVKNAANDFRDYLKGNLTSSTFFGGERASSNDPCGLDYSELINGSVPSGITARGHPCTNLKGNTIEERFSNTLGGQCTDSKMRGGGIGACAPYRRLHLCHHNLESISNYNSNAKHDLLAEVCMAAKFEGESLRSQHGKHKLDNNNPDSQICTVLARSFADIGDIIRRRDIFRGNDEEKKKREDLEENLKKIFKNIQNENTKLSTLTLEKVREYWWELNRETVWKAITCGAHGTYFHATCGESRSPSQAHDKCRCDGAKGASIVPTYFDYVPQFLRWFEEWAEDFCRLRKHKLKDAIDKCRRPNGQPKYCDLNRYDCEKTASGKHVFGEDDDCKDCQYSCARFVNWIDNQKLEFEKQKRKYTSEMQKYTNGETRGGGRKKRGARGATTKVYDGYEKKFYDKFKTGYSDVIKFLEKLNKEDVCTKKLNDKDEEEGKIDFKSVHSGKHSTGSTSGTNVESQGTFYRTTYCEACPWCGAEKDNSTNGGGWKAKTETCGEGMGYKDYKETKIPILTGYKGQLDIVQKYKKFCASVKDTANGGEKGENGEKSAPVATPASETSGDNSDNATIGYCGGNIDSSLCEKWTCYYYKKNENNNDSSGAINFCVLQNGKQEEKDKTFSSYNAFFWDWVHDMLIDSIKWRNEHGKCINNNTNGNTCITGCKSKCDCFLKWVQQKEKEWKNIVKHFKKQGDIEEKGDLAAIMTPDIILKLLLEEDELLEIIEGTYGKSKETEHIRKMLEKENEENQEPAGATGKKNIMDKLIEHELQEAEKCKKNQEDCQPPKAQQESPLRSAEPRDHAVQPAGPDDIDDDDDDDEDEDGDEVGDEAEEVVEEDTEEKTEVKETETKAESKEVGPPQQEASPTPAPVVDVCPIVKTALTTPDNLTKACPTKYGSKAPTSWKCIPSGNTSETTSGDKGSICIPPRRRKLYLHKLPDGRQFDTTESLRKWFIESSAVETFFLWDRYKKLNTPQSGSSLLDGDGVLGEEEEQPPQTLLQSGKIPPPFLRQMFYTLGDYRDLCVGKTPDGIDTVSGKDTMENIKKAIDEHINSLKQAASGPNPQPRIQSRETLWETFAPQIWNGMICALTYDTNTPSGEKPKHIEKVKEKLWDDSGNKPKDNYQYTSVTIGASGTEAKDNSPSASSGEKTPPKLSDFVEIPPFFRWLHEWGEEFCGKRARMLEQLEKVCRGENASGDPKYCSGDGHDCEKTQLKHKNMFDDLDCRDCYEQCRKYRKWIRIKFEEFEKQKDKYDGEFQKLLKDNSNGGDNTKFCQQIKEKKIISVDKFLESLDHCKDGQNNNDPNNKINFNDPKTTFGPLEYCRTCPLNGVNCTVTRGRNGCTPVNGNEWETVFNGIPENGGKSSDLTVEMIDRRGPFIKNYSGISGNLENSQNSFKDSYLFKSVRNQQWECRYKDEKTDICKLKNFNDKIDLNQYTTFKVLIVYWLDDFLYGYYLLKKRKIIEQCKKNGGKTCDANSKNDCVCVKKWLNQKKEEWKQIQERFNEKYKDLSQQNKSLFRSFLETLIPQIAAANDKKKTYNNLDELKKSLGCNCANHSHKSENSEKSDIIDCMLNKLENLKNIIKTCQNVPSGNPEETCEHPSTLPDAPEDEEEELEPLEEENPVEAPNICPETKEPPEDQTEETCEEPKEEKEEEKNKGTDSDTPKPSLPDRAGPAGGERQTPKANEEVLPAPSPADQPLDPTILQTTIPFGVADTQNDIQNDGIPSSKITDNEWNQLKHEFISQYLQSEQPKDVPNDYSSGDIPFNTQPNTLYFDKNQEKPFITSIHDRDLYSGEEYNYDMFNSGKNGPYSDKNDLYSGNHDSLSGNRDPTSDNHVLYSGNHHPYSGIDLINDSLSGDYDIYDEVLKRKEKELFGTNHVKQTSIHSVAKPISDDPIHNQLELFHRWLDRHRDMCEQWENHHERLAKLKEQWENDTSTSGNTHPSDSNKTLNTDVSIQIHMDNPKTTNEFTYVDSNPNQVDDTYVDSNPDNSSMDTILEDLDKPFNEPYYYDMYDDDIYYDVNDDNDISTVDSNNMDVPSKVQIEMDRETEEDICLCCYL